MNKLEMPPSFPEEHFNRIHQAVDRFRQNVNYLQFQGGWNAVAYRYIAMTEYDERFTASIKLHGPGPGEPERYRQERNLFGFASNAYSMFDALHYAMFIVGSFVDSINFDLANKNDERNINFGNTKKAFGRAFGSDAINQHFSSFSADKARIDLDALRNMLTHRASPPRAFRLNSPSTITRLDIEINARTTTTRLKEAQRLLSMCLDALDGFISRH